MVSVMISKFLFKKLFLKQIKFLFDWLQMENGICLLFAPCIARLYQVLSDFGDFKEGSSLKKDLVSVWPSG